MPLNLPNVLTLLRILAVPVVVVALLSEVEDGDAVQGSRHQKFLGSPRPRRAMMFFWISEAPPPMVSTTVQR